MDKRRKEAASPEVVKAFFAFLEEMVQRLGIKCFWNMDETSLSSEEMKKAKFKVLVPSEESGRKPAYIQYPETDGHVTVVACGCTTGAVIPPYFLIEVPLTQEWRETSEEAEREGRGIAGFHIGMGGKNADGRCSLMICIG
jgi:hypothetical protein